MIEIEIEIDDAAWIEALPDAEAIARRAAEAALASLHPPAGKGRDGGVGREGVGLEAEHRLEGKTGSVGRPILLPSPSPPAGKGNIVILLADDQTVAGLNQRFRGKAGPTNVLSFPAADSFGDHLGDIALAYGVCAGEARDQGKRLDHHLAHLVAHGVLHLLGYDHETDGDAEVMEALERSVLEGLGVPDPYAAEHR